MAYYADKQKCVILKLDSSYLLGLKRLTVKDLKIQVKNSITYR